MENIQEQTNPRLNLEYKTIKHRIYREQNNFLVERKHGLADGLAYLTTSKKAGSHMHQTANKFVNIYKVLSLNSRNPPHRAKIYLLLSVFVYLPISARDSHSRSMFY